MKRRNKKYSKEFRQEAVNLVLRSGKSALSVAAELGISQPALSTWVRQAQISPEDSVLLLENQRLKKELGLIKKEHEILVKAAAFFAKRSG